MHRGEYKKWLEKCGWTMREKFGVDRAVCEYCLHPDPGRSRNKGHEYMLSRQWEKTTEEERERLRRMKLGVV